MKYPPKKIQLLSICSWNIKKYKLISVFSQKFYKLFWRENMFYDHFIKHLLYLILSLQKPRATVVRKMSYLTGRNLEQDQFHMGRSFCCWMLGEGGEAGWGEDRKGRTQIYSIHANSFARLKMLKLSRSLGPVSWSVPNYRFTILMDGWRYI